MTQQDDDTSKMMLEKADASYGIGLEKHCIDDAEGQPG